MAPSTGDYEVPRRPASGDSLFVFSMTKLMTQLTSVQLIEAALWRELGSTEPQSQDVLRQALTDAVSRWLLIRS